MFKKICQSYKCNRMDVSGKKGVEKNVGNSVDFCPDCKHALLAIPTKPKKQRPRHFSKYTQTKVWEL